jgi:hypothetical protein
MINLAYLHLHPPQFLQQQYIVSIIPTMVKMPQQTIIGALKIFKYNIFI